MTLRGDGDREEGSIAFHWRSGRIGKSSRGMAMLVSVET